MTIVRMSDTKKVLQNKRIKENQLKSKDAAEKQSPILTMSDKRVLNKIKEKTRLDRIRQWPNLAQNPNLSPNQEILNYNLAKSKIFFDAVPRNSWANQRVFIVGGGPSLKDFNFKLLEGELSIGINRAIEKYDPTILFSMDTRVWGWLVRGKLGEEARIRYENFGGYQVWLNNGTFCFPDNIFTVPDLGICGTNSGHASINLAIELGAKEIYLLGFDMKGDGKGNQRWFHDGYPDKQSEGVYKTFRDYLHEVAPAWEKRGIKVINLNPESALKCFKFDEVKNVLNEKKIKVEEKPLFVSYYTKNTGYEKEAHRLMGSLNNFNLDYDIQGIDSLGGWKKNTYYKATFLKEMLDKHPGRNIVWLDADSAVFQMPDFLLKTKADISVCIVDWSQYKKSPRQSGIELLSGAIFLKNNNKTHRFVEEWINENKNSFARIAMEQHNLKTVLDRNKSNINFIKLPDSYCQIFDSMSELGEPVIEFYQASRHLKREVGQ